MIKCEDACGQIHFETAIDLEPGHYQYYFLVDGENRYCPEKDTMTNEEDQIVNYIIIPEIGSITSSCSDLDCDNPNPNNFTNNFNPFDFTTSSSSWSFGYYETYWSTTTTTTTQQSAAAAKQRETRRRRPVMPPVPRQPCMKQACCKKSKPKLAKRVHFEDDKHFDDTAVDVPVFVRQ